MREDPFEPDVHNAMANPLGGGRGRMQRMMIAQALKKIHG
jgi:hypothetical protein